MLAEGLVLMFLTEIWKRLSKKLGFEASRLLIHGVLFGACLIYAVLKYFGYWDVFGKTFLGIWAIASGLYEISKTFVEEVISQGRS